MSADAEKDWKWQIVDELDNFVTGIDPDGEGARELLLEDEGQVNLVWDAIKPFFPTNRFKPGDKLTAIELGRFVGHWRNLWIAMIVTKGLRERIAESHNKIVEARNKIDVILVEHLPSALNGIGTSICHILAVTNDPVSIDLIRKKDKDFQTLAASVRQFVYQQPHDEREAFMKGYGQALSAQTIEEDGSPKTPNHLAQLLAFCRPFAIRAELAACDFQEHIEKIAGRRITGHPEAFAKHLQRRKASLRGKGRPAKNPSSNQSAAGEK